MRALLSKCKQTNTLLQGVIDIFIDFFCKTELIVCSVYKSLNRTVNINRYKFNMFGN